MNEPLLKLAGLWEKTSAKGNRYLIGKLTPHVKIVILPNTRKNSDSDPDFQLFVQQDERKTGNGERQSSSQRQPKSKPASGEMEAYGRFYGKTTEPAGTAEPEFNDEIPFCLGGYMTNSRRIFSASSTDDFRRLNNTNSPPIEVPWVQRQNSLKAVCCNKCSQPSVMCPLAAYTVSCHQMEPPLE